MTKAGATVIPVCSLSLREHIAQDFPDVQAGARRNLRSYANCRSVFATHLVPHELSEYLPDLEFQVFGVHALEQVEKASDQTGPPSLVAGVFLALAHMTLTPWMMLVRWPGNPLRSTACDRTGEEAHRGPTTRGERPATGGELRVRQVRRAPVSLAGGAESTLSRRLQACKFHDEPTGE